MAKATSFFRRNALRMTPPIFIYASLLWLSVSAENWKAVICLLGLVVTVVLIGHQVYALQTNIVIPKEEPQHNQVLAKLLLLSKRLGGLFCSLALIIGVASLHVSLNQFSLYAIPVIILANCWAVFLIRRLKHQLQ